MSQNPLDQSPQPESRKARGGWLKRLLGDVLFVVARDRKWWVVPVLVVLFLLAGLLFLAAATGPLAPFIYPLL